MAGTYMIPANKSSRPTRSGWTTPVNLLDGFTSAITIPTALKSKSFGVKSVQVYGNDPLKVYQAVKDAIQYIKKNKKPFLIEVFTYRTISHVGPLSDDITNFKKISEFTF